MFGKKVWQVWQTGPFCEIAGKLAFFGAILTPQGLAEGMPGMADRGEMGESLLLPLHSLRILKRAARYAAK